VELPVAKDNYFNREVHIVLKGRNFFYGWVIVAVGFLALAIEGGCIFYSFGIFLKPMIEELGVGRAAGTAAFTVFQLVVGMSSLLVAVIIGKFGCRLPMAIGFTIAAIGMALLSRITEIWQLWLLYGVMVGGGVAFGHLLALTTLVNFWFVKRKSLAIGIVVAGMGAGPLVFSRFIASMVETIGWRSSWQVLAGVVFLFAAIPALLFIRNRPEDMGQVADGVSRDSQAEDKTSLHRKKVYITSANWDVRSGIRTRALWLIVIFACANQFTLNMMNTHQIAHLTDIGIAPVIAAGSRGLMIGISGAGRFMGGALGDRIEPRHLVAAALLAEIVALLLFITADSMTMVYIYVVLLGFSYGMILVLHMVMIGNYYGAKAYAKLASVVMFVTTPIYAVGPLLGGYIYDSLSSYVLPFSLCAGFLAIGFICVLLVRPPSRM
jgi:sugar phosphate permease